MLEECNQGQGIHDLITLDEEEEGLSGCFVAVEVFFERSNEYNVEQFNLNSEQRHPDQLVLFFLISVIVAVGDGSRESQNKTADLDSYEWFAELG